MSKFTSSDLENLRVFARRNLKKNVNEGPPTSHFYLSVTVKAWQPPQTGTLQFEMEIVG
jgi:hypothetical protein